MSILLFTCHKVLIILRSFHRQKLENLHWLFYGFMLYPQKYWAVFATQFEVIFLSYFYLWTQKIIYHFFLLPLCIHIFSISSIFKFFSYFFKKSIQRILILQRNRSPEWNCWINTSTKWFSERSNGRNAYKIILIVFVQ